MQATNDSKDDGDSSPSAHNSLISWANVLRNSHVAVPKAQEVKILCQPTASRLDGPDSPFVNIEAFIITDSSMPSYATGWIGLVSSCINASGEGSLLSGYFCTSNSSVFFIKW